MKEGRAAVVPSSLENFLCSPTQHSLFVDKEGERRVEKDREKRKRSLKEGSRESGFFPSWQQGEKREQNEDPHTETPEMCSPSLTAHILRVVSASTQTPSEFLLRVFLLLRMSLSLWCGVHTPRYGSFLLGVCCFVQVRVEKTAEGGRTITKERSVSFSTRKMDKV